MAVSRYSLTDYILSVKVPNELREIFLANSSDESQNIITIGGDNSYVGQIEIGEPKKAQWTVEGDDTGSYVANKSKNQTGDISVQLNQVSDKVNLLTRLFQTYYDADTITEGLTLTISKATSGGNQQVVATGSDCYITTRPAKVYGSTATTQTWTFACGRVTTSGLD